MFVPEGSSCSFDRFCYGRQCLPPGVALHSRCPRGPATHTDLALTVGPYGPESASSRSDSLAGPQAKEVLNATCSLRGVIENEEDL
ncbi:unnamed protein product [Protopolystoma xenopodis]|uniref:Uncharacterized protein n=1 Tax=Protopolystoma xenopodis TaxID=117903 RepID=A0A3S5AVC0_9PLAT|nr:unnamed protein product [Protopolystoma xenopodis]